MNDYTGDDQYLANRRARQEEDAEATRLYDARHAALPPDLQAAIDGAVKAMNTWETRQFPNIAKALIALQPFATKTEC